MTWRVLRGRREDGSMGFDISKPGYDVRYADKMHMAFTSDLKIPKVVKAGTVTINPTNGVFVKDLGLPGGGQTVFPVPYGQTLPFCPVVVAVGKCDHWLVPLNTLGNRNIITGLWGKYITPIYETFLMPGDLTYGTSLNHAQPGHGDANSVEPLWAACAFLIEARTDQFIVRFNGSSPMTLKYLVLRYP